MFVVKQMEKGDVKECVKLLFLCSDELKTIFGDEYIGKEILEKYYKSLESYEGLLVAKAGERVAGFAELNVKDVKRKLPFKDFLVLGFTRGLKTRLLLDFFDKKANKNEVYIRHFCIHPKLNVYEVGKVLLNEIIDFASKKEKEVISVWLPVESDVVDLCLEFGFKIKRMLESSFAEKYFGKKYYYLLELRLE